jgi:hypothetical protein
MINNGDGTFANGPSSSVISTTTPDLSSIPIPPSDFTAVVDGKKIHLTWTDHSSEAGFSLARIIDDPSNPVFEIILPANTTSYTDSIDVSDDIHFVYYLRSVNEFGYGGEMVSASAFMKNFSLVDTRTGETILKFEESVTIDEGHPDFANWTIQANTYPNEVGSVVFKIDNKKQNIENRVPYLLHKKYLRALSLTPHILVAEAFSGRHGTGTALQSRNDVIRFVNSTAVTGLEVVNTSGEKIHDLCDGCVLNTQDPALHHFNIAAILNRNVRKGSVQFYLNGEFYHNENQAPYLLAMGNRKWWNEPGLYTVSAVPYSRKNGGGIPGTPISVTFLIEDNPAKTNPVVESSSKKDPVDIYPVPALGLLNISVPSTGSGESAHIVIWNMMGEKRFDAYIPVSQEPYVVDLERAGLQKGMHYIRIAREGGAEVLRFFKE